MRERAAIFRTMLPKATSVSRVTSAFWQSIEKAKRQGSTAASTSDATNAAASTPRTGAAPCCASCVTAATGCTTPALRL